MGQYDKNNDLIVYYKTCSKDLAKRNKRVANLLGGTIYNAQSP